MALITIDEAARYLGVTTRTISTYIAQGIISYHKKKGTNRKFISSEDVQDLMQAKEEETFSIKKFRELSTRVRKLEAQIDVLMRILDTKQIPLGLDKEELCELYETAITCSSQVLNQDYVEAWLPILMRIDENDFKNLEKYKQTREPWVPFLDICLGLIVSTTSNKDYAVSLVMQNNHKELAEARRRLRLSALLYIESRGASVEVDQLSVRHPDTTIESVKKLLKSRHN